MTSGRAASVAAADRASPERAAPTASGADSESAMWLWTSFALGLARVGAHADPRTFATTVDLLRRGAATLCADGAGS